jgi:hypothetical protein
MQIKQINTLRYITEDGKSTAKVPFIIGKGMSTKELLLDIDEHSLEESKNKPVRFGELGSNVNIYIFKDRILKVMDSGGLSEKEFLTYIKHWVLQKEKEFKKIERQVEAFEQVAETDVAKREKIPDSVKMFVWQRDEGKCVKCGKKEKLEFDHIIPVAEGGSNTERNIQILCESCNRSKGKLII